ncbi:glycosyltransferase family 2 protein [Campylobacter sp. 9BO]|uniref:glycosyltransferase family 2 protein n=1 Tax=Campylobacter sp. 9BO TaxID=3424759 RepID=UPI003D327DDE
MYRLAFIIPHFNHSEKIELLVDILLKFKAEILIIDDGSSEFHRKKLACLNAKVIYRDSNGGKGAALKDGFFYLKQNGFTHAFQIDADMQHDLTNLQDFIELSMQNPKALICGAPVYGSDAPKSRLYGRKITNFWVAINTLGFNIKDAMCGLRIYPVDITCELLQKCRANRMDFDIEIMYLLYKNGVSPLWLDVLVCYKNDGISHFKAFRDNVLISKTHAIHFFALPKFILKRFLNG